MQTYSGCERCLERHIILNDEKADMKKNEISFMGHQITKDGIRADPNKATAIREMPSLTDIHDVKRFCGMASAWLVSRQTLLNY